MRSIILGILLLLSTHYSFSQNLTKNGSLRKFSYLAGIGVSSQYTTDVVSHLRAEMQYRFSAKTNFVATLSYTPQSVGDTFAVYSIAYFNDENIIGNEYSRSAVTQFSMIDFGLFVRQSIHPKIALRVGPAISRLVRAEHRETTGFLTASRGGSSGTLEDVSVLDFEGIRNTLWGADLGVDVSVYKRFSLNYTSAFRFTDITKDDIYGPHTNRIMKHNLSLNYTIR